MDNPEKSINEALRHLGPEGKVQILKRIFADLKPLEIVNLLEEIFPLKFSKWTTSIRPKGPTSFTFVEYYHGKENYLPPCNLDLFMYPKDEK